MRSASRALCLLSLLALPAPLLAQGVRVPAATVQRVISSEFAFCSRTESASSAELGTIQAEISQAIAQAQRRVTQLVADSAAAGTRLKNAQAKVDEIDAKLSPLQVERNKVLTDMKPHEDKIAQAEQGSATAGQQSEHAQLMAQEAQVRQRIAYLTAEVEKVRKVQKQQDFFQSMTSNEGPVADLRAAQKELEDIMTRLREIRRTTLPIRYDPAYLALQRRLQNLNTRIDELDPQLDAAKRTRDDAKTALENLDVSAIELAHEENLYVYEHMTRAQHCVEKRQLALNQAAPPVATTTAGSASGKWGVFCRFTDPDYGELTDGGTFTLNFDGRGGVGGSYVSSNATYPVGGSIRADGSANGSGSGSGWSVDWNGRFGQAGGGTVGNGNVNVKITNYGGGSCSGTWTVP